MAKSAKATKAEQFIADMIRHRGIEFARLGMMVEVSGDIGTIEGMNSSCNLNVKFANTLKHGKGLHNCHPWWNVKYFDETGQLIAHFNEGQCVCRPNKQAALVAANDNPQQNSIGDAVYA